MKLLKLKPVVLALGLSVVANMAFAQLGSNRAVVKNDGSERVSAHVNFVTPVSGDLYVATQIDGQLFFLTNGGTEFTPDVVPLVVNSNYVGKHSLFDFSGEGIAPGRYPLYQVVTVPGSDPLNFTNWIGGLAGLHSFNFSIGLDPDSAHDLDDDGFHDDDTNHDGFHDDDLDHDGFHDDDLDHDGFHDRQCADGSMSDDDHEGHDHEDDEDEGDDHEDDDDGDDHEGHDRSRRSDLINSCTTPAPTPTPTPAPAPAPSTAAGKALYATHCASCHGANPANNINKISKAVSASATRSAINSNKGGMSFLSSLTDSQLQDIAAYVKNPQ